LTLSFPYERTNTEHSGKPVMRIEPMPTQVAGGFSASKPKAGDGPSRLIEALRNHIARLEHTLPQLDKAHFRSAPWTVGIPEIDSHLATQGLARHGLHDVSPKAYGDMPAAMGVSLAMALQRLADPVERRPLLWCRLAREVREYGNLYGHGLETLGLSRHRFVTVTLRKPVAAMWVAEEALKSGALALVIVDTDPRHASLTATRRLALAAHAGKAAGLMVFATPHNGSTASHTRWIVAASRSQPPPHDRQAPGSPSWNLELTRARGGRPGAWVVEWQHAAHRFNLVSKLRGGEIHPWADEAREITTTSRLALRAG
jgi:protein ImuA